MTKALKPPDDRLYGRIRGHKLRPRQQELLDTLLPRLRFPLDQAGDPLAAFPVRPATLTLEIGFGGGEHALALAAAEPGAALIACEVFETGICSLLSAVAPEGAPEQVPPNLMVWDDDARILLRALPDASLDRVCLMFPDPWPKLRHIKRRFVHPAQIPLLARKVRPGGEWRIASDDPTYQSWVVETMSTQALFEQTAPVQVRPAGWPPTRYEAKALRAGRLPLYWRFLRSGNPA